MMIRTF